MLMCMSQIKDELNSSGGRGIGTYGWGRGQAWLMIEGLNQGTCYEVLPILREV